MSELNTAELAAFSEFVYHTQGVGVDIFLKPSVNQFLGDPPAVPG